MWIQACRGDFSPSIDRVCARDNPDPGWRATAKNGQRNIHSRSRLSDGTGDVEQVGLGASQGAEQITASDLLGMQAISLGLLSQVRPLTRRARHGI